MADMRILALETSTEHGSCALWCAGIPSPGIEYYLPLFFEQTAHFFDYLPADALILTHGDQ